MLSKIIKCFFEDKVFYTSHARKEMNDDEFGRIKEQEVVEAIQVGAIIEDYSDDKPYPSALIYGKAKQRPLHIVCAYSDDDDLAIIITVYRPDPDRWDEYRRRK